MQCYDKAFVFLGYAQGDEMEILAIENALLRLGVPGDRIFQSKHKMIHTYKEGSDIIEALEKVNLCIFLWTNNIENRETKKKKDGQVRGTLKTDEIIDTIRDEGAQHTYHTVDIVGECLNSTLKEKQKKYAIKHIEFQNRHKLVENANVEILPKLEPLLKEIQITESLKEENNASIKKMIDIGSDLVRREQYKYALILYKKIKEKMEQGKRTTQHSEIIMLERLICHLYSPSRQIYRGSNKI